MIKNDSEVLKSNLENWLSINKGVLIKFIIVFGILEVAAYFVPGLLSQSIYSNDMAQWTAWAYQFQDHELFNGDANAAYWMANFPIGYYALLRLLGPVVDPQVLGEFVGMGLGGLTTYLSYQLGRHICGGRLTGGFAALLLVFIGQFSHFQAINLLNFEAGGLPRGFAMPLLLLGYLGVVQRQRWQFVLAVVLAGLFYPPVVVSLGAIAGLLALARIAKNRAISAAAIWPLFVIAGGLAIAQANVLFQGPVLGRQFSFHEIAQMAEFHEGGILPLFYANPWNYAGNALLFDKGIAGTVWFLFTVAALALICIRNDVASGRLLILVVPISAVANYALAYLLLPKMYEPSRYILFPYLMLTVLVFAYFFDAAARWLWDRIGAPGLAPLRAWQVAAGTALVVVLTTGTFAARYGLDRGGMNDPMPAAMYDFIAKLPKDAVVAGMPALTDRIPMRAQRSVLLMSTSFYPYHVDYYRTNLAKFDALILCLTAQDGSAAAMLRDRYAVRYLVVDTRVPLADPLTGYEPLKSRIADLGAASQGSTGFVARQARDHALFRAGPYSLIALD